MILLADSEGLDQTARMRSLIWAFAVRICSNSRFRILRPILNNYLTPGAIGKSELIAYSGNEGLDQPK